MDIFEFEAADMAIQRFEGRGLPQSADLGTASSSAREGSHRAIAGIADVLQNLKEMTSQAFSHGRKMRCTNIPGMCFPRAHLSKLPQAKLFNPAAF